jgi:hypothetical protein
MPTTRFFRRGLSKVYWLPAVAAPATGPTSTEITAGTDLSPQVQAVSGFEMKNTPIKTPDLATSFDSQIDGADEVQDCSLTFYDDSSGTSFRTPLAKGTNGFVVLMPYGNTTAKRCEVWPARTTGYNDTWSMDAQAAMSVCTFAITAKPSQTAVLP